MIGHHDVDAAGRGLQLLPSLFTIKPVPSMSADELPGLCQRRAPLVRMLEEPLPTIRTRVAERRRRLSQEHSSRQSVGR
jgi:hypothetical protein